MVTFLFWNIKSNNLNILSNFVRYHSVDILILAECPMKQGQVLSKLNSIKTEYRFVQSGCNRIHFYTRFEERYLLPVIHGSSKFEHEYFSIRHLQLPGRTELLLCAVHFPSKLHQKNIDQTDFVVGKFAPILREAEETTLHKRTILVGDLNMNPYEDAVVTASGLHAVPTRKVALRDTRKINKAPSNRFFYNPMWKHFGENIEGRAGTYYFSSPKARADYWNIYDQVLVRPNLLAFFKDDDVKILSKDLTDNIPLIDSSGQPRADDISDHLPLLFRLHI